jgi:hypothetical protein
MSAIATPNVRHSSLSNEHYSPPNVVEAAREALGQIDLDPATSIRGNAFYVKAKKIFTLEDDGFNVPWSGRVLLNPPGGRCDRKGVSVTNIDKTLKTNPKESWTCDLQGKAPCGHGHPGVRSSQKQWWKKLALEWLECHITSAVFVGFSLEILQVTQSLEAGERTLGKIPLDFPFCVPSSRIAYHKEVETGPDGRIELVEGSSPPHGSVLIFLPAERVRVRTTDTSVARFEKAFSKLGRVIIPGSPQ